MKKRTLHCLIFLGRGSPRPVRSSLERKMNSREVLRVLGSQSASVEGYSTLGLKSFAEAMLWFRAASVRAVQDRIVRLLRTQLGRELVIRYTLLGIERESVYVKKRRSQDQAIDEKDRLPYLVVYPFTKTHEWHALDFDERYKLMGEHVMTARKHQSVRQLLLYAYGIDDHEFIVSYEMKKLLDFQNLVMALRATKGRAYTKNDLPIFTCIHRTLHELMDMLQ